MLFKLVGLFPVAVLSVVAACADQAQTAVSVTQQESAAKSVVPDTSAPLQFWKTIATGLRSAGWPTEMTFCDDGDAYVAHGTSVSIISAEDAEFVGRIDDPYAVENLQVPLCIPSDSLIYVTPGAEQLNRKTRTWRTWPEPANLYTAITPSRVDPDLLYAGEHYTGDVAVLRRSTNARQRRLNIPSSKFRSERVFGLAVMPNDAKIYVSRAFEGGILVVDPKSGKISKRIAPDMQSSAAIANRFRLSNDSKFLYAAVEHAATPGISEISTRSDSVVRYLPFNKQRDRPVCLALSPSGKRLFVTTTDVQPGTPSSNYLIDIPTWRIIAHFARVRSAGAKRVDGCPAFRPDGKLLFLPRNTDVDVYLNRE